MARKRSKQDTGKPSRSRQLKQSQIEAAEAAYLEKVIQAGAPARSSAFAAEEVQHETAAEQASYAEARKFHELPISKCTIKGLDDHGFKSLTAIQRACIPHAVCGRDVLGAAKTGSGKTLAFLIPVVEALYRARWTEYDGLGALIISPTRELALQIFEELRKVGKYHSFSAGLLIGGKSVADEARHINSASIHHFFGLVPPHNSIFQASFDVGMNILVAAPGRLLHHMDSTPGFDCSNIICLVLDEADRCLDLGFSGTMDAIISNLPNSRHTMLFSATQSKRVSDLARLSLKDPEFISVHAEAPTATPHRLKQFYVTSPLHSKLDVLWFFIKTHLKKRTIVFLATCKQVKFVYEAFRKLRPGVPLAMLHGKMKQNKRMGVFYSFNESKSMVLFATDIAARGLDFPNVDWVVQADCPEDADAYIHRVGRTARFQASGDALLFLLPSEEKGMLEALRERRVPLKQRTFAAGKVTAIGDALTALLARSEDLKAVAQAAFVSYIRSVFLNPNKSIFDVSKLDVDEFASSLGLPTAPRLRMVKKLQRQSGNAEPPSPNAPDAIHSTGQEGGSVDMSAGQDVSRGNVSNDLDEDAAHPSEVDVEQQGVGAEGGAKRRDERWASIGAQEGEDDDLLVIKRHDVLGCVSGHADSPTGASGQTSIEQRAVKKKKKLKIRPGKGTGIKTLFDADGHSLDPLEALQSGLEEPDHRSASERFQDERERMRQRDEEDRQVEKRKRQEARARKKARLREAQDGEAVAGATVTLGAGSDGTSSEQAEDAVAPDPQTKRRRVTAAYRGMLGDDASQSDSGSREFPETDYEPSMNMMSLAEQEALALRLL